ncbi:MAG: nickel-dependent lactate racemase [Planctomycetes bacterium]|nr:nickel-dependent lactate racemase [Planctomycetota bacterium]
MPKQSVHIPYGRRTLRFTPPDGVKIDLLHSEAARGLPDAAGALGRALRRPLSAPALGRLAVGARRVAVVVSDVTRPVPNRLLLGEILPALEAAGVPREGITIIIGTGTHRPAPPDEIRTILGARVARRYRVVNHDCRSGNKRVGFVTNPLTRENIPLLIDRLYVEADLKIVTGLVEPHIFCGYSGGRKAVLPGIAALTTIRKWHGPELIAHPESVPGVVAGNIPHALSVEASRLAGADFAVNVTLNGSREITGVFAGDIERVFEAAAARVEEYALTRPVRPAKVVVTSGAGWPLDATFYQAIKGLVAVFPVLAPGGLVVLAARADEGIGDEGFTKLVMNTRDVVAWSKALSGRKRFHLGQWQLQRMGWVRERGKAVFLVSDLSDAQARAAFTEPFSTLQEAVYRAVEETGALRIVVVPEGPYVVTRASAER